MSIAIRCPHNHNLQLSARTLLETPYGSPLNRKAISQQRSKKDNSAYFMMSPATKLFHQPRRMSWRRLTIASVRSSRAIIGETAAKLRFESLEHVPFTSDRMAQSPNELMTGGSNADTWVLTILAGGKTTVRTWSLCFKTIFQQEMQMIHMMVSSSEARTPVAGFSCVFSYHPNQF